MDSCKVTIMISAMTNNRYALDLLQGLACDKSIHQDVRLFLWNAAYYVCGVGSMRRPPVPGYEQEAGDWNPLPLNLN